MLNTLIENINTTVAKIIECMARDPKRAERLLGDVKKWAAQLAEGKAKLHAASEPVARNWTAINAAIEEYVDGYELRADEGDHTPTEFESFLILDAIHGLLADDDFLSLMNAPPQPSGELRECGNGDCGWRGHTDRMLGSIGPLCPECGETTELVNEEPAKGAGDVALPALPEPRTPWALYPPTTVEQYGRACYEAGRADRQQRGGDVRRHPLEAYAESYDMMARIAAKEGREAQVSPTSVARDIRHNMIPATIARAALAAQPAVNGYTCTVPDNCEALHWRGQILSMNELASVAQPAVSAEPWKPLWDDIMAVAESAGTPTAAQMKEWAWRLRRCAALAARKPDCGDAISGLGSKEEFLALINCAPKPGAEDSAKGAGDVALPPLPEHQFLHKELGKLWDSTAMYLYALRHNVLDRLRRQQRGDEVALPERYTYAEWEKYQRNRAALAAQPAASAEPAEVTDAMALAFHHAITDGAIGQEDVDEIKTGLRAALRNVALAAHKPDVGGNPNLHHYGDVLQPFAQIMADELLANAGKGDRPGWLSCSADALMLEVYYHAAKLQKAVKDGNRDGIREYSADVANLAMMVLDVCGGIDAAISAQQCRGAATAHDGEAGNA